VIAGTRFPVASVVEQIRVNGWGLDEFHEQFPHLRRDQIEAALVYYVRFPDVIDEDIRTSWEAWEQLTGTDYHGNPVVSG
jgi:uncharacterized protein (DUF433 family)